MESRLFIKAAKALIARIENYNGDEEIGNDIQQELGHTFLRLQNPTLPSAYRLRDAALNHGFNVDQRVIQRLAQFEFI